MYLLAALTQFERLGALPWAERTMVELDRAGARIRRRPEASLSGLTPQELQVAFLAAEGATNRESAAALFLSPKTIDYHLRKVYDKLGIRSRIELARFMAEWSTDSERKGSLA